MADIIHRVGIKSPVSKIYAALSTIEGLEGWWTKDTTGTSKVGGVIEFRFYASDRTIMGEMHMDVLKLDENKLVHWRVKSGPPEWIGTDITFNLSQEEDTTIVLFGHRNWREPVEFMAHCSMKWATFLLSLRELVETGKGKPAPNDVKIDNWN
jgi:uncharacterized protein YndB with AHSA1/START domain